MKPLIGITTDSAGDTAPWRISLKETYSNAIRAAGGLPILLPLDISAEDVEEYVPKLNGVLFSGGSDLSPHLFKEEPIKELNSLLTSRDNTEMALMKVIQRLRIPIFGICRGIQTINTALGGTLFQDIPQQIPGAHGHYPRGTPAFEPYHSISILQSDSRIGSVFKKSAIRTNSFHHQSIKQIAPGLRVTAQASDGVIEACESTESAWYIHAVQFHPEAMCEKHPEFLGLFIEFVNACRK